MAKKPKTVKVEILTYIYRGHEKLVPGDIVEVTTDTARIWTSKYKAKLVKEA